MRRDANVELWIRKLREKKGWTQADLASRMGTSQQNVQRLEKGQTRLNIDWMRKLGAAFGMAPKDLLAETVEPVSLTTIPVIGSVEAGTWREAVEWAPSDRYDYPVNADPDYPGVRRFGLITRGPSMNLIMPDGTILICAKLIDLGENPSPGDYVVCQRRRPDGLVEATVKEYVVDKDGKHWLWPRSDHPAHQTPIPLPEVNDDTFDDANVTIEAVVLSFVVKARGRKAPAVTPRVDLEPLTRSPRPRRKISPA